MILHFNKKKQVFDYLYTEVFRHKLNIIISAGSTIKKILKFLTKKKNLFKNKILLSDERIVSLNSNFRNQKFFLTLIKRGILKKKNFLYYKYDFFSKNLLSNFSNNAARINFEYAVLGLGAKSHFSSIFNFAKSIKINDFYYFISNAPKKPKNRITVSLKTILKCKKIFILANKKKRYREIKVFLKNKIIKQNKKKIILIVF